MTDLAVLEQGGLVLVGCGKMGSALLAGWLKGGVRPADVWVIEPNPSDWLRAQGVHLNAGLPDAPKVVVLAVKPQMMGAALPDLAARGMGGALVVSIAAGTTLATFEAALGAGTRLVRAMPNTPAAIGRGITAICANAQATPADLDLAEALLCAVGQVVRLEGEHQMDAVTAVSGSGPAYVFHLIETLAAAAEAEGLPPDLAAQLAQATVAGAGALAETAQESPAQLRVNVTSPGGTTAAGLAVLMDPDTGFPALVRRAVHAAAERGRELGRG
ncbi:pyrroline-5-carboxylate reductase [Phaeovulum vinaykumarii]|uniref:Pyrroline-5-carboxylate reductase n=1 Tax=Phaeovulum vinaykumarii TaxID=407234 RepID=A0A1N7L7A7_9RHOB|nr:pyrroline-5-carboxylate reductase [Phaeovulum vinaykumarii]SIS69714.1 pyrroline-5-carboxylate reductase [Phaeovulum vinaykumarii]SOB99353.1 pyrroline-5-carboxylate reductase [Phaeovulum vinaykumarii]